MKQSISYKRAVEKVASFMEYEKTETSFFFSTFLCYLFETDDKTKTLQDIVNERKRYLKR